MGGRMFPPGVRESLCRREGRIADKENDGLEMN